MSKIHRFSGIWFLTFHKLLTAMPNLKIHALLISKSSITIFGTNRVTNMGFIITLPILAHMLHWIQKLNQNLQNIQIQILKYV